MSFSVSGVGWAFFPAIWEICCTAYCSKDEHQTHKERLDYCRNVLCLNHQFYPLYHSSKHQERKQQERASRIEQKTKGDREEEEERGGGKALFRQPDNLPSLEHIYGCPLTPSSCSLWRQSEWCWPACRFPIISHAERSCLPIHQQVRTQTLMAIHQPQPNSTQLWSSGWNPLY